MSRVLLNCNGCTTCCRMTDPVKLRPDKGDKLEDYLVEEIPLGDPDYPGWRLKWDKETGNCVYLTEQGCSIHTRSPWQCHTFSCIDAYHTFRDYIENGHGRSESSTEFLTVYEIGKRKAEGE